MSTYNCIWYENTFCWKPSLELTSSNGLFVSGRCIECLTALEIGTFGNTETLRWKQNGRLASGSMPQVSGFMV